MASILQTAGDMVGNVGQQLHQTTQSIGNQLEVTTNQVLPPKHREQMVERFRAFAGKNPKSAAFLTAQTALTGIPFALFLAFAATTILVSVSTCLFFGLLVSITFSFFAIGIALIFVVPTLFLASCAATLIFLWGFVGFLILQRFNEGEAPAKPGTRIGDKLHGLTGGRSAHWSGYETSAKGSQDRRQMDQASSGRGGVDGAKGPVDRVGSSHSHLSVRQADERAVNGINGTHGAVEWERKWADGVHTQPVVMDTDNPFEVLKEETPIS